MSTINASASLATEATLRSSSLRSQLGVPQEWADPMLLFDPSKLPPLLEIPSPQLASRAVRHPSVHLADYRSLSNPSPRYTHELDSYEVLETIGDAYLDGEITRILQWRYPDLTSGGLVELRQALVRNQTLSYLALAYGLPGRLEHTRAEPLPRDQDVAADLFEAHIGGLVKKERKGRNLSQVEDWLDDVFSSRVWTTMDSIASALKAKRTEQGAKKRRLPENGTDTRGDWWTCVRCDVGPEIGSEKPRFVFDPFDQKKGWHARMLIGGEEVSCGKAKIKREAEVAAANNYIGGASRKGKTETPEVHSIKAQS